jgi:hypothetical protein
LQRIAHVPLVGHPKGVVPKVVARYGKHRFGRDVEPIGAAAHHSGVFVAAGVLETAAESGCHQLDPHLMMLAVPAWAFGARASQRVVECLTRPETIPLNRRDGVRRG